MIGREPEKWAGTVAVPVSGRDWYCCGYSLWQRLELLPFWSLVEIDTVAFSSL